MCRMFMQILRENNIVQKKYAGKNMLTGMTGFATKNITIGGDVRTAEPVRLTLMLKSLNAKFFETTCKLPFALAHLETEIVKHLREKFIRGSLQFFIQTSQAGALKQPGPAFELAENYVNGLRIIQQRLGLPGEITIADLVHLPHVFEQNDVAIDDKTAREIVHAVDELADLLMQARTDEGASMEADICERIVRIESIFDVLKRRAVIAIQNKKDHAMASFEAVFAQKPGELRDQQLQLLQIQLGRYEINEEIVRFAAHLDNLRATIADPTREKGKKIDFILQELFREINTIGSKANDSELSASVIAIKVELEKIREQAQNIL